MSRIFQGAIVTDEQFAEFEAARRAAEAVDVVEVIEDEADDESAPEPVTDEAALAAIEDATGVDLSEPEDESK